MSSPDSPPPRERDAAGGVPRAPDSRGSAFQRRRRSLDGFAGPMALALDALSDGEDGQTARLPSPDATSARVHLEPLTTTSAPAPATSAPAPIVQPPPTQLAPLAPRAAPTPAPPTPAPPPGMVAYAHRFYPHVSRPAPGGVAAARPSAAAVAAAQLAPLAGWDAPPRPEPPAGADLMGRLAQELAGAATERLGVADGFDMSNAWDSPHAVVVVDSTLSDGWVRDLMGVPVPLLGRHAPRAAPSASNTRPDLLGANANARASRYRATDGSADDADEKI